MARGDRMTLERWTFQADNGRGPETSSQRFNSRSESVEAACDWLRVCAHNDFYPAVRVAKILEEQ